MQRLQEIEAQLKEAHESIDEAERRRRQVDDSRKAITEAGVKYQRACVPAVLVYMMLAIKAESNSQHDLEEREDRVAVTWMCASPEYSLQKRGCCNAVCGMMSSL